MLECWDIGIKVMIVNHSLRRDVNSTPIDQSYRIVNEFRDSNKGFAIFTALWSVVHSMFGGHSAVVKQQSAQDCDFDLEDLHRRIVQELFG